MKSMIIIALALVAVAVAVPVDQEPVAIVESSFDKSPEGSYSFGYKSGDGSARQEEGKLKEVLDEENKPHNVVVVRGSYSYVNTEGVQDTVNYYADQSGYHAEGPSVPKAESR